MSVSHPLKRRGYASIFRMPLFLLITALALCTLPALASSGDRQSSFKLCHSLCEVSKCEPRHQPIPLLLRAFGWSCSDDCIYLCAHRLTNEADTGHEPYHQFFGKWAFYRLGPIQEPLSTAASIGNLLVHYWATNYIRANVRRQNRLRPCLLALAYIQMNTWMWSTVFHTKDTPRTERLDYFSAMITIASTLLYAVVRIFGLVTPRGASKLAWAATTAITLFVVSHFIYVLTLDRFPYGYHVNVAIVLGMLGNVLWCVWCLSFKFRLPLYINDLQMWPTPYPPRDPRTSRVPDHAFRPLLLVFLTVAAMSLEILDFPPLLRTIDAHALWHIATIPLAYGWWLFMVDDVLELETAAGQLSPLPQTTTSMPEMSRSPALAEKMAIAQDKIQ